MDIGDRIFDTSTGSVNVVVTVRKVRQKIRFDAVSLLTRQSETVALRLVLPQVL